MDYFWFKLHAVGEQVGRQALQEQLLDEYQVSKNNGEPHLSHRQHLVEKGSLESKRSFSALF